MSRTICSWRFRPKIGVSTRIPCRLHKQMAPAGPTSYWCCCWALSFGRLEQQQPESTAQSIVPALQGGIDTERIEKRTVCVQLVRGRSSRLDICIYKGSFCTRACSSLLDRGDTPNARTAPRLHVTADQPHTRARRFVFIVYPHLTAAHEATHILTRRRAHHHQCMEHTYHIRGSTLYQRVWLPPPPKRSVPWLMIGVPFLVRLVPSSLSMRFCHSGMFGSSYSSSSSSSVT